MRHAKNALIVCLSLVLSSLGQGAPTKAALVTAAQAARAAWSEDTRQAFGFEKDGLWSAGEIVQEPRKAGQGALRWDKHTQNSGIGCLKAPSDFSAFNAMSFWLHSSHANNATFMIIFESPREKGVFSYYSQKVTVDWVGWQKIELRFRAFGKAREPAGWDKISTFRLTASGWNQRVEDESVWVIDDLQFDYDPKPYRPKIRVDKYVKEPPREAFLKNLRPGHPRLILLDDELPRIKQFIAEDPLGKKWYEGTVARAESLYRRPPRHHELPDGRRLLSVSRDVLDRMYNWGFMFRMTGDRKWLDRAWQEMEAVVNFPDWNPSHYLDTAEMMHAMAIGYDWFYNDLTEEQRKTIREGIWQHGLRLSYASYMGLEAEGMQGWRGVTNNWNFVCNGGTSLAVMALLDEMPEKGTDILHAAYQYIQIPIHHFEPDGAWWEGIGYWGYSMRYLLSYFRGLETTFGTDFGFIDALKDKGFSMAGDFPIYLTSPRNGFFNFADSGSGGSGYQHWGLFYLASALHNPLYLDYQRKNASSSVESLIYYKPFDSNLAVQDVPLDKYFRKTEVVTARSSWTDPNALFLGIKGGRNGIAHSHQDLGSFVLYGLGERWFQDMGTEGQSYQTHKNHLSHDDFYRLRTEGHNTLLFNPEHKDCQNHRGEAKITRFETSPEEMFATTDLTDTYDKFVVSATRGFRLFDERRALLVQDEIEAKAESDLWWFAHGAGGTVMTVAEDGRSATLERNGKLCDVRLLAPADARLSVMNAQPLPTSPNPEIQQQNKGVKKLAIHLPKTKSTTIAVLMVPRFSYEPERLPSVSVQPLASWELGAAKRPRLGSLTVGGETIAGFSPDVFTYTVELPAGAAAVPQLAAQAEGQGVRIDPCSSIPGTARVTVGGATLYEIRFAHPLPPGGTDKPQVSSKPAKVRGITVTASHDDGNLPKNVLDGDLDTRWSASGEDEWIALDFGQPRTIEAVSLAWFSGGQRSTSFQIETSADGKDWQLVKKLKSSGKTDGLESYPLDKPLATRYLRIHCFGNSSNLWNSMAELQLTPSL
jgi:hypothetical protein